MVEWNALIPVGRGTVGVHFEGGSFTSYGMAPAEYSTSNAAMQKIIETSGYFASGKIRLLRTVEETGDVVRVQNNAVKPEKTELRKVCVESPDDAKDFLEREFGTDRVKLRTKAAIEAAGCANGVAFEFVKAH